MEVLDPLAIRHIALPSGNALEVVGVHQVDFEPTIFERLEQGNPIYPCRFHGNRSDTAGFQPIGQRLEITSKRAEFPYRFCISLRRDSYEDLFCPDIDAGRIWLQHR